MIVVFPKGVVRRAKLLVRSGLAAIPGHVFMDIYAWASGVHHYPFWSWMWWARTCGLALGILAFFELEAWARNGARQ
jgi:hypothetical protein